MDFKSALSFKLILGSSSIYRRQVLADMGYAFRIMTANIDEKAIRKEKPEDLVMAIAEAKADAIVPKLQIRDNQVKDAEPTLLVTADTVVVYEGSVREKPSGKEEARKFMKDYSGSSAQVVSSVVVTNLKTGFRKGEWDRVEIEEGIVSNVAGGLITEHPLMSPYVRKLVGAVDSLMGLPMAITERLTKELL
ncbi:7-methyl-GTP pyrophosphatase-like protein [Drosera capensis]